MVELIVLPRFHARLQRSARERLAGLMAQIGKLNPDDAAFVTVEDLSEYDTDYRREIVSLRNYLRGHLGGLGVTSFEDYDRAGVWVYKRVESHGTGVALGREKEAEIRNRPIAG